MNLSTVVRSLCRNNLFQARALPLATQCVRRRSRFASAIKSNTARPDGERSETSKLTPSPVRQLLDDRINSGSIVPDMKRDPLAEDFDPEYIDMINVPFPKAFNLAAYADRSPTLRSLIDLGVDLSALEVSRDIAEYLLALNFETQCTRHVRWLHDNGLAAELLGKFITKNPLIFDERLDNLDIRVKYLRSKMFTNQSIALILERYPRFINYSIKHVDRRLGYVQKEFKLIGDQVRAVVTNFPKVIGINEMAISVSRVTNVAFARF